MGNVVVVPSSRVKCAEIHAEFCLELIDRKQPSGQLSGDRALHGDFRAASCSWFRQMCDVQWDSCLHNNGSKPLHNSARLLKEAESFSYLKYSMKLTEESD